MCSLSWSAQVAITKYHRLGDLENRILFPHSSGLSLKTGYQNGQFVVRMLLLAYRQPSSPCALTWHRERALMPPFSYSGTIPIRMTLPSLPT